MVADDQLDAFRSALLSGAYNLLVGSGISLDSTNARGETIRGAETLRHDLCALKSLRDGTSLARVSSLLTSDERDRELVQHFSNCNPGPSLVPLPRYLWRRLFTFNIDDVLEALYDAASDAKQTLVPRNYVDPFEPTPDRRELLAIHLHGWARQPEHEFVFSHTEYARVMSSLNPWMHLLSEILATESFIIAGTSLNEVDLEYYLSHRSSATPRRGKGPSIFIEPNPDAATESDCRRHGLTLVKATFGEFLSWLESICPRPPTLADLILPDFSALFPDRALAPKLLRFFTEFALINGGDKPQSPLPSPFLYGRPPEQDDLDQHLDINRSDSIPIETRLNGMLRSSPSGEPRLLLVLDDAGTGKTTLIRRIAHDFANHGQPVLAVRTLSRIDVETATECISAASETIVLLVDGLADAGEQIAEILADPRTVGKLVVLASERSYRQQHLDLVLAGIDRETLGLAALTHSERQQLIERYRAYGLIGSHAAIREPAKYADLLENDPIAVAVCRILNDFRPLDGLIDSLWQDTADELRLPYLCVALARHCHMAGVRYSILQAATGLRSGLSELFTAAAPLGLVHYPDDDDYVIPLNAIIGERVLHRSVEREPALLFSAFERVAKHLAPHVNRLAIQRRSPEARLSGRIFDADKIVRPFLGSKSEDLYIACQTE